MLDHNGIRNIDTLKNWDKNPRSIKIEDFNRLKAQITKFGQYKPLVITEDGTVLGGNMRLRAYKDLGMKDIWVSVVHPKDEKEMVEYALSDNDRAGYYDEEQLAELVISLNLDLEAFKVDKGEAVSLKDLIEDFAPDWDDSEIDLEHEDKEVICPKCGNKFVA